MSEINIYPSRAERKNMDLKQEKPIHLRCPKCGYDFSYNTNHIEEEIDTVKIEIASIISRIADYKREHRHYMNDPEYRNLNSALKRRQSKLANLKKARKATAVEIKLQTDRIFRQLVEQQLGREETMKLLKEAEDQMVYYNWDVATQTFTRFEGS